MASKEDDDEMHFYFFCQKKGTSGRVVFDLHITTGQEVQATLKANDAPLLADFGGYLRSLLEEGAF
jgi:hypothetical protein